MDQALRDKLLSFGGALVDQHAARIVVEPNDRSPGYWFGGGNLVETPDRRIHLVGRYRNSGDSTTGLGKGDRGLELAVFSSSDRGQTFSRTVSWRKSDLSRSEGEVLSIEGAALNLHGDTVELFVSTEKSTRAYPAGISEFQKPGTGVWTIDRIAAGRVEDLAGAEVVPLLCGEDPGHLHVKDPVVYTAADGTTLLVFCTHPYGWTSSNPAYCMRAPGSAAFGPPVYGFFPRGLMWDVAATRITDILSLDAGLVGGSVSVQLVFYDGAECLRPHEENRSAVHRPRGYSCEELGGLAVTTGDDLSRAERLSDLLPVFVSPHGTGSSRYVHTLATEEGIIAAWQQAQPDGSQPLVMHALGWDEVRRILSR